MIRIEQFKDTIYEKGYGNVAKLVMVDKTISIGAKALYSYLCSYAFGKDEAYPTVERIMQELNISENSFRRYRKELEDKGYITIEFKNIKGTNRNVYKINNSVEQKKEPQNLTPSKFGTHPKSAPSNFGTQIIKDSKEYNNKNIINNKEKKEKTERHFTSIYQSEEFKETFNEFIDMRKSIKKPATNKAIEMIIIKLEKVNNEEQAIKMLERSIINNWQDVYEIQERGNDGSKNYKPNNKREVIERDYNEGAEIFNQ